MKLLLFVAVTLPIGLASIPLVQQVADIFTRAAEMLR